MQVISHCLEMKVFLLFSFLHLKKGKLGSEENEEEGRRMRAKPEVRGHLWTMAGTPGQSEMLGSCFLFIQLYLNFIFHLKQPNKAIVLPSLT